MNDLNIKTSMISGVIAAKRVSENGKLVMLSAEDHLLKGISEISIVQLRESDSFLVQRSPKADIYLFPLSGNFEMIVEDVRPSSPSFEITEHLIVKGEEQVGWILPFGVTISLVTQSSAEVVLVVTNLE